jgi:hypothetical protein
MGDTRDFFQFDVTPYGIKVSPIIFRIDVPYRAERNTRENIKQYVLLKSA